MFQKLHICEKVYFDQILGVQILLLLFLHTFNINIIFCAIFYSLDAEFFNTIRVSNSLDPDQARHFAGPDLGPNCLQSQQKSPLASKKLNTKQLVDTTFWLKPWLNKIVNFIWLQLFPFG